MGASAQMSPRVACAGRMGPPSKGISHIMPVDLSLPCLEPFVVQERQLQSSAEPVQTCSSDESSTGIGPVHFVGCFWFGSGAGGGGIGACVRVIATESPRSSDKLKWSRIVWADVSCVQPEIVGPVTVPLPL